MQQRSKGFTLIEVMIVVVIVGILAGIAYPSYQQYVLRGHRSEGQALLADAAARQERFRAQRYAYTSTLSDLGLSSATSSNGYYQLRIVSANATSYSLSAVAQGAQTRDSSCSTLTLDAAGNKGPTLDCWK